MSKMQEGKKAWLLDKEINYRGSRMTKRQMIEMLVRSEGQLKRDQFPKYIFSRAAYNRMDYNEQRQYEEKLKTKMPYAVQLPDGSYYEITQTEAEYFLSLGGLS